MINNTVKKREVFYISGYDPRGARYYYSLYKEHLQKQNRLNNIDATVSSRKVTKGTSSWQIIAHEDGVDVKTNYTFLSWTDIMGQTWSKSIVDMTKNYICVLKAHIFTGLIFKYTKLAPHMLTMGIYSVGYIPLLFFFTFLAGFEVNNFLTPYSPLYISLPFSFVLMYIILKIGIKFGKRIAIFWLLNLYTIPAKWSRGKLPNLEKKIDKFVNEIFNLMKNLDKNNIDEVLVVGHSVGSMLSIPVLAKILRLCEENNIDSSKLKLLTLGGNIPLMSLQKEAYSYRNDLQYLALKKDFIWLDYTSVVDGTCFPMLDPIESAGLMREKGKGPIIRSARFHKIFTKQNYKKLRYKWFEVHFLYLMSADIAGEYDYFKITAGSKPLELNMHNV